MQSNTALLLMDLQTPIMSMVPDPAAVSTKVNQALAHARKHKIPVIYVTVGFRPGAPEISPNNKGFMASKSRIASVDSADFLKVDASVAPRDGDIVVVKRRVSAFTGSDLEVVLRGLQIGHIVLTGISTSGVVLSTVREASDKDYVITVLSDGCFDPDPEVHQVLVTKVFPRQADVLTVEEWSKK
jgi:nicotinamidase-related amidase